MATVKIRITCENNSDARSFRVLDGIGDAKHNGGKVVIATVDTDRLDAAKVALDGSHKVAGYEIAA